MSLNVKQIKDWGLGLDKPLIISGPCSAETSTLWACIFENKNKLYDFK